MKIRTALFMLASLLGACSRGEEQQPVHAPAPFSSSPAAPVAAEMPPGTPGNAVLLNDSTCRKYDWGVTQGPYISERFEPAIVDSAFRLLASCLRPFAVARDSALAIVRGDSGTPAADATFLAVDSQLARMERQFKSSLPSMQIGIWWEEERPGLDDSLRRLLSAHSLSSGWSEGTYYIFVDHASLRRMFGAYLSTALIQYLYLVGAEETWEMFDDGSVMLPWDSLGERAWAWAEMAKQYPLFPRTEEVNRRARFYRDVFLVGTGNTPVFDYGRSAGAPRQPADTGTRVAFARFIERHPASDLARLVEEYVTILKANDYLKTPAVDAFLRKYDVDDRS